MRDFDAISMGAARDILSHLDLLVLYHEEWESGFMRAMICNTHVSDEYLAVDAHETCRFGVWLYQDLHESLKNSNIVNDIKLIHRNMHLAFRDVFTSWKTHGSVSVQAYDEAHTKKMAFNLSVITMQSMIYDYLFQVDPLTKTLNRTKLLSTLERERNRIAETKEICSVVMVDIDHFKRINDTFGHAVGDTVLVQTSLFLSSSLRPMDILFRYGGEEFLMYLPSVGKTEALSALNRIRETLANNRQIVGESEDVTITASFGVTALDPLADIATSIDRADQALYEAKRRGRNQVVWLPEE